MEPSASGQTKVQVEIKSMCKQASKIHFQSYNQRAYVLRL